MRASGVYILAYWPFAASFCCAQNPALRYELSFEMSQVESDTSLHFGIDSKSSEAQNNPSVPDPKSSEAPGRARNPAPVPVLKKGQACLRKAKL